MGMIAGGPQVLLGQNIAGYKLEKIIGSGSSSVVYMAHNAARTPVHVAIKVLTFPWQFTLEDQADVSRRFFREFDTLMRLRHPHIVQVLDAGEESGLMYAVLPYFSGGTLATLLEVRKMLSFRDAARYASQIADALDYAHSQGVVHKDVKPANVLLDDHMQAYLTDFGVAQVLQAAREEASTTAAGRLIGTPEYMAPEQIEGGQVGPNADIYSLGVVLYRMTTGRLPFGGDHLLTLLKSITEDQPVSPRTYRPDLPAPAEVAILRALAKMPMDRFDSALALVRAYEAALVDLDGTSSEETSTEDNSAISLLLSSARSDESIELSSTEPSLAWERLKYLRTTYISNTSTNMPPYAAAHIQTRQEAIWVILERRWSGERFTRGQDRVDFRNAELKSVDLGRMRLFGARFAGANLRACNLSGSYLDGADLSGADLRWGDLGNTSLVGADLRNANLALCRLSETSLNGATLVGADLSRADLRNADLERVDLRGANLSEANLSGARLRGALLDVTTLIRDVTLDAQTQLGDVIWNGAQLTQIDWARISILGDESAIAEARTRTSRIRGWRTAARAYRGLALALRDQGLVAEASYYRLRQQRIERCALFLQGKLGAWLFSFLLDVVAGYGERPLRTVIAYVLLLLAFSLGYVDVAHARVPQIRNWPWWEWLALSISSFHGRGFFPGTLPASGWITYLALLESIVGLFIEFVFIATFSRRFLGQ